MTGELKYHPLITSSLYNWQISRSSSREWTILDLPIPVYDKLHIGHFYNKVIKDITNRYKLLKGYKVNFPIGTLKNKIQCLGFNCHGLIAENIAIRE